MMNTTHGAQASLVKAACMLALSLGAVTTTVLAADADSAKTVTKAPAEKAPGQKIDLTKTTRYYADPATPNISGVWRSVRDTYRPRMASDIQRSFGQVPNGPADGGGLPPGVLPRDFWIVDGQPLPGHSPGGPWVGVPFTPKWQAAYDKRVEDNRNGKVYGDPHFDCLPRGAMGSYHGGNTSFSITQTPGRILQIFEEQAQVRYFYTDERKHPAWSDPDKDEYEPTPHGHSIAHWEGKTLVVDTVGVSKKYTLGFLLPHSEAFHMVERFTRLDDTHMDVDIVVDDKKAFTKPMSMKIRYQLYPNQDFVENTCENNRNTTDENGYVQSLLKSKKQPGWDLPED